MTYLIKIRLYFLEKTYPSFITAILDKASGTETPAATNVNPITVSGIPKVLPEKKKIENINFTNEIL